jgi:hypothetical protein
LKWLALVVVVGGCSYTFDSSAPDITLLGGPPNTDGLPRLNHAPAGEDYLVLGYDDNGNQNANWVAFDEEVQTSDGPVNGLRTVRLDPPQKEELVVADQVTPGYTRLFLVNHNPVDPKGPPILSIRAAGQPTPPITFNLPGSPGFIGIGYGETAFLYWVAAPTQQTWFIFRSDGSFMRELPIPSGTDVTDPQIDFDWSGDSQFLVVRDVSGDVIVHATTENSDVDLGMRPKLMGVYGNQLLITCGDDGLRTVTLDGATEKVLDPMACDEHGALEVQYQQMMSWVYYGSDAQLLRVPLDGSGPPEIVLKNGLRPLAFLADGRIMYSRTPSDEFVNSAGDGWLDNWKFMNRGLDAGLSSDGKRVRFLENAATPNGAGELLAKPVGSTETLHLAQNTRQWEELGDGRILADADHAFRGVQNRIVVIDEKTRTARWVASAAADYMHIPGTSDLLIDVVTGPTGYDIVRVPIPPPDAPPDGGTD